MGVRALYCSFFVSYFTGGFHREVTDNPSDKIFQNLLTLTPDAPYVHTTMYVLHRRSHKHKQLGVYLHVRTVH